MWIEKHGAVWRIREQVAGSKVTLAGGFTTKTAANKARTLMEGDKIRGDFIDPRGARMFLSDWIATYWPVHEAFLKPAVKISETGRVRNHILPALGHLQLGEISTSIVQTWIADLLSGRIVGLHGKPLAQKTVSNIHGALFGIMAAAVDQRLISINPCVKTKLPQRTHSEMRFLTAQEIERLLVALPEYWRPLVLLMVTTGLRWGEAIALRCGRVDVLGGKLTVLETLHELSGVGQVFTEPKTEESRRTVTFGKTTANALVPRVANKGTRDLMFTTQRGTAVRARHFRSRVWLKSVERAGLEGVRVHDLRHTHAAWLIASNVPLTGIQRRLGHSSITVTSDLYGHLLPAVDASILKAVEDSLLDTVGGIMGEPVPDEPGATRNKNDELAGEDTSHHTDLAA